MTASRLFRLLILLVAVAAVAACGNKGDLVRPGPRPASSAAP